MSLFKFEQKSYTSESHSLYFNTFLVKIYSLFLITFKINSHIKRFKNFLPNRKAVIVNNTTYQLKSNKVAFWN